MEGLGAGLEGEGMGGVYNKMARGVLFWIGGAKGGAKQRFAGRIPKQRLGTTGTTGSGAWERQGNDNATN